MAAVYSCASVGKAKGTSGKPLGVEHPRRRGRGDRGDAGSGHHNDRGSTCTAADGQARLADLGMIVSMSRKANCGANAVSEATIGTIKAELLVDYIPADVTEVQQDLFPYIETYYNRVRLHSSLGYRTPDQIHQLTSARGAPAA